MNTAPRARTVRIPTPNTATATMDQVEDVMIRRAASAGYEAQRRPFSSHWDDLGPLEQDRWCFAARAVLRIASQDITGSVRAVEGGE